MNVINAFEEMHTHFVNMGAEDEQWRQWQDDPVMIMFAVLKEIGEQSVVNINLEATNDNSNTRFRIQPIEVASIVSFAKHVNGVIATMSARTVRIGPLALHLVDPDASQVELDVLAAAVVHGVASQTLHWSYNSLIPQYKQFANNMLVDWESNHAP